MSAEILSNAPQNQAFIHETSTHLVVIASSSKQPLLARAENGEVGCCEKIMKIWRRCLENYYVRGFSAVFGPLMTGVGVIVLINDKTSVGGGLLLTAGLVISFGCLIPVIILRQLKGERPLRDACRGCCLSC